MLPVCLNVGEALYYILNIVLARKLNRNKDSRNVSPITAARLCRLRHVLTHSDMKLTVICAWGTLDCLWCTELRCDTLQVLCVLSSEVFCAKNKCVYYIFVMPGKCLIILTPSVTCVVNWPSDLKGEILPPVIKKYHEHYFGCKVGDQDKCWASYMCCVTCVRLLKGWINGSCQMTFKHTVKCTDLPFAMRPVLHSEALAVPKTPENGKRDL